MVEQKVILIYRELFTYISSFSVSLFVRFYTYVSLESSTVETTNTIQYLSTKHKTLYYLVHGRVV
jgi:hypothetical protein